MISGGGQWCVQVFSLGKTDTVCLFFKKSQGFQGSGSGNKFDGFVTKRSVGEIGWLSFFNGLAFKIQKSQESPSRWNF